MKVSAVIPTRNRHTDLVNAVQSVLLQTLLPQELLIIDQSPDTSSKDRVLELWALVNPTCELIYVHDSTIAGLVAAKDVAVRKSRGDLVMFLEDDVVLEKDYIANMCAGFEQNPEMLGSCGVITAVPRSGKLYHGLFHLFHRGIFKDARLGIHGNPARWEGTLIPSRFLSGGLSAYRRHVFESVPFDTHNGFFMMEDMEFSMRTVREFGMDKFFINPSVRADHRISSANRAVLEPRFKRKVHEHVLFYKRHRDLPLALTSFIWLYIGLLVQAGYESIQARTAGPIIGCVKGLVTGIRAPLRPIN